MRTILTELPPLVGELLPTFTSKGVVWSAQRVLTVVNLSFLDLNNNNNNNNNNNVKVSP
jgi:hypothetical protein